VIFQPREFQNKDFFLENPCFSFHNNNKKFSPKYCYFRFKCKEIEKQQRILFLFQFLKSISVSKQKYYFCCNNSLMTKQSFFKSFKVSLPNFLLIKGTLFWLGIICYFFANPGSKVVGSHQSLNPGPSDSQPDAMA